MLFFVSFRFLFKVDLNTVSVSEDEYDAQCSPNNQVLIRNCIYLFFSIWLNDQHLTNEHRTQDCIAS